jgi:murein DD-endopeptidase MepM/ murein hydrolase activator NlpD
MICPRTARRHAGKRATGVFVITAIWFAVSAAASEAPACAEHARCMAVSEIDPVPPDRNTLGIGRLDADHDDAYLYRLPYGNHVSYAVLQSYGSRLSHRGAEQFTVDFRMPEGTLVHAAREGIVALVEDSHAVACWSAGCGRFANFVVVVHEDGTTGEYYHLARGSAMVAVGDDVARGQALARSGNTGYTTGPHLHFGVYRASLSGAQSIAVRFLARVGIVGYPRTGARYENAGD